MDLILAVCNDLFLDAAWARIVPLSAFADVPSSKALYSSAAETVNASHTLGHGTASAWSHLVSSLPHPPLPPIGLAPASATDFSAVSAWPREYIPRQLISLLVLTIIGISALYFIFAGLSYYFIFNHDMMKHPRFLKGQVKMEIMCSLQAFPGMTILTMPWFQLEVMGYSKLYDNVEDYGWAYFIFSMFFFLLFTDYCIYWIHRTLHVPAIYKRLHKPHHKWIIPTPWSSHAFHPLDGYAQSVPYHLFIFLFPCHRKLYLCLFTFVNFWSIFIHDSDMITGHPLENVINGPAHHTLHHLYFTVNYGQYFTWADRVGGSYRHPKPELDPMLEVKAAKLE